MEVMLKSIPLNKLMTYKNKTMTGPQFMPQ